MVDNRIPQMRGISRPSSAVQKQKMQAMAAKMLRQQMRQVASQKSMQSFFDSGFNQVIMRRNFKTLEEQRAKKREKAETQRTQEVEEAVEKVANVDELASRFNSKNEEFESLILIALRNSIKDTDTVEEILQKVLKFYPDPTLAYDALDFLLQTTYGALGLKVLQAKEQFYSQFTREIVAGQNIRTEAKEFSKAGLGTPTSLRDMYRDITGNPRLPVALFDELSDKFTYNNMKTVISFLLHSLGSDLKAKGPSISRGELQRLVDDTRTLQAILGVYRFFLSRMNLISSQFKMNQLTLPQRLNFELIAKQFIFLFSERYITIDKVFQLARLLGISEEVIAQIIIFTQMRDAVRQVSPRLYKNQQQKEDLLSAILEALEELEEEAEEEEEEEDEDEEEER